MSNALGSLGPAPLVQRRLDPWSVVEALLQQQDARIELVIARPMALGTGQHHHFLQARHQRRAPDANVFELHGHGRAGMQLQGQDARHHPILGVVVGHLGGDPPVDDVGQLVSFGQNDIVVPVFLLDDRLDVFGVPQRGDHLLLAPLVDYGLLAPFGQNAPTPFLVEDARIGFSRLEVSLVTPHHPVAQVLAAILNARIAADNLERQPQFEVVDVAVTPDEERVSGGLVLLGGLAGDRPVADGPELGIAIPPREVFAVEQALEPRFDLLGRQRRGAESQKGDGQGGREPDRVQSAMCHKIPRAVMTRERGASRLAGPRDTPPPLVARGKPGAVSRRECISPGLRIHPRGGSLATGGPGGNPARGDPPVSPRRPGHRGGGLEIDTQSLE